MNKKRIRFALGVLSVIFALFFIVKFATSNKENREHRDWNNIKEIGRLRVVAEKSGVGFQLQNGKAEGFSYELIKAFADSMKLELEVNLVNDLDSAILGLWENKYDLIASNLPITTKLNQQINLTMPIVSSRLMLIQQTNLSDSLDSKLLTSYDQLKDIEIVIPNNSPYKMRLDNLSDEIAEPLKIKELDNVTTQDLVQAVSDGKLRYTICDELQARKLSKQFTRFDYSMPLGFNQQYAWGMSKSSLGLLDEINKFLKDFLTTNAYWDIYRKYY